MKFLYPFIRKWWWGRDLVAICSGHGARGRVLPRQVPSPSHASTGANNCDQTEGQFREIRVGYWTSMGVGGCWPCVGLQEHCSGLNPDWYFVGVLDWCVYWIPAWAQGPSMHGWCWGTDCEVVSVSLQVLSSMLRTWMDVWGRA